MDKMYFSNCLSKVFSAHGKTFPAMQVAAAIFARVGSLPDDFMSWAVGRLEDYDKLPPNLGRELRRELWPDYLEKHPELKAAEQRRRCNTCSPDMAGFFRVWDQDGKSYCLKCACNDRPDLAHIPSWTPRMALDAGMTLSDPATDGRSAPRSLPPSMRAALGRSEEPRPGHVREVDYANATNW